MLYTLINLDKSRNCVMLILVLCISVPMAVEEQVCIIYTGVCGHLDKVDPSRITSFEEEFVPYSHQDILQSIRDNGKHIQSETRDLYL